MDPPGPPLCLGDEDGNGIVNISDVVYLTNYIFGGGDPPKKPPECPCTPISI